MFEVTDRKDKTIANIQISTFTDKHFLRTEVTESQPLGILPPWALVCIRG